MTLPTRPVAPTTATFIDYLINIIRRSKIYILNFVNGDKLFGCKQLSFEKVTLILGLHSAIATAQNH